MIIYTICLVLGLMFTLFSAIAGHLFGGHDTVGTDGQADAGFSNDGMPGVSFFSPTILASFITAFGAFGMILAAIPATLLVRRASLIGATLGVAAGIGLVGLVMAAFGYLGAMGDGQRWYGAFALNLLSPLWPYRSWC